ncbi:MAG TPA: DUF4286 family protein [Flavobacteriaceae bacterium]|nr:DUF4286 family protein [Flavobacteriaceae bacterium]
MYIYNVTVNIQEDVHDQWLKWMKHEHIPEMLSTGKFSKALMTKVLVEEVMGGITYSVQYFTESKQQLDKYYKEDAEHLRKKSKVFDGKFVAFRTELEIVSEAYPNPIKGKQ